MARPPNRLDRAQQRSRPTRQSRRRAASSRILSSRGRCPFAPACFAPDRVPSEGGSRCLVIIGFAAGGGDSCRLGLLLYSPIRRHPLRRPGSIAPTPRHSDHFDVRLFSPEDGRGWRGSLSPTPIAAVACCRLAARHCAPFRLPYCLCRPPRCFKLPLFLNLRLPIVAVPRFF